MTTKTYPACPKKAKAAVRKEWKNIQAYVEQQLPPKGCTEGPWWALQAGGNITSVVVWWFHDDEPAGVEWSPEFQFERLDANDPFDSYGRTIRVFESSFGCEYHIPMDRKDELYVWEGHDLQMEPPVLVPRL